MTVPEHLKFKLAGFSGTRVGYVLAVTSFLMAAAHPYVSCEESELIAGSSVLLFVITLMLSFITPRTTPNRYRPAGLAFVAFVANSLLAH